MLAFSKFCSYGKTATFLFQWQHATLRRSNANRISSTKFVDSLDDQNQRKSAKIPSTQGPIF